MGLTVLLTNMIMTANTGTETVVAMLADGLRAAGHRPMIFTPNPGSQAERLRARGHVVVSRIADVPHRPDIIHAQHIPPALIALAAFPRVPAVFVSHSAAMAIEQPIPHPRFRFVVAVDELVAARCRDAGIPPENLHILLNAVDMDRFRPRAKLPVRPHTALLLTKHSGFHDMVQAACAEAGIRLATLGPGTGRVSDALEAELPRYDLVFATARMALEAAAVGCAVVVADGRGFAGPLTTANLAAWRRFNFGLGLLNGPLTQDAFRAAIDAYDPVDAAEVSRWLRQDAGLADAITAYVALYRAAIAAPPPSSEACAAATAAWLEDALPANMATGGWRGVVREITMSLGVRAAATALNALGRDVAGLPPAERAPRVEAARAALTRTLIEQAEHEMQAFNTGAVRLLSGARRSGEEA